MNEGDPKYITEEQAEELTIHDRKIEIQEQIDNHPELRECLVQLMPLIQQDLFDYHTAVSELSRRYLSGSRKPAKILFRQMQGGIDDSLMESVEAPTFSFSNKNPLPYELINGLTSQWFRLRYVRRYGNEKEYQDGKKALEGSLDHPDDFLGWFSTYPGWYRYGAGFETWYGDIDNPIIPMSIAISEKATKKVLSERTPWSGRVQTRGQNYDVATTKHRIPPREFIGIILNNANKMFINTEDNSFISDSDIQERKHHNTWKHPEESKLCELSEKRQRQFIIKEAKKISEFLKKFSHPYRRVPILDTLGNLLYPVDIKQ